MAKRKKAQVQPKSDPPKRRSIRAILTILALVVIGGGIGGYFAFIHKPDTPIEQPIEQPEQPAKTTVEETKMQNPDNPVAVIELAKGGTIEIELFADDTPKTVANFVKLTNEKFYNGLTFHRVEPGFVAQGGDPDGNGMGGPGYTIEDEKSSNLHVRGALGMAKSQAPNSAGSQFYICLDEASFLDGGYTVFGQVLKGMEYVDKIQVGDKMKSVTMKE